MDIVLAMSHLMLLQSEVHSIWPVMNLIPVVDLKQGYQVIIDFGTNGPVVGCQAYLAFEV